MTITTAHESDVLDWPAHGITMTRGQAERLVHECGIDLPDGETHIYTEESARQHGLIASPFSALRQRMEFHHRGPVKKVAVDLEPSE